MSGYIQIMKSMKRISKNNYNAYNTGIDSLTTAMTEDEYRKAVEFHRFLVNISNCNHGILSIDREKLIKVASAFMECGPLEAYNILRKMKDYGWILTWDKDFIIVNVEAKT
jgi:hypothetical protein